MAKVTSKLQVTIPKIIADRYGISPGDEIEWAAAGDAIRVSRIQPGVPQQSMVEDQLNSFDRATERQKSRESRSPVAVQAPDSDRGWTREELYGRGGVG